MVYIYTYIRRALLFDSSMRVDEGRTSWGLPAIKMKARTVVGRGEGGEDPA